MAPRSRQLTADELRRVLQYARGTGAFRWRVRPAPRSRVRAGDVAGHCDASGYVTIKIRGVAYMAHRLAYLYVHGVWPDGEIDHRNTLRADNRWRNLRDVAHQLNAENERQARVHSQTGLLGASPLKDGRFGAFIKARGRSKYLGAFDTPEQAHRAYVTAKRQLHEGNTL